MLKILWEVWFCLNLIDLSEVDAVVLDGVELLGLAVKLLTGNEDLPGRVEVCRGRIRNVRIAEPERREVDKKIRIFQDLSIPGLGFFDGFLKQKVAIFAPGSCNVSFATVSLLKTTETSSNYILYEIQ